MSSNTSENANSLRIDTGNEQSSMTRTYSRSYNRRYNTNHLPPPNRFDFSSINNFQGRFPFSSHHQIRPRRNHHLNNYHRYNNNYNQRFPPQTTNRNMERRRNLPSTTETMNNENGAINEITNTRTPTPNQTTVVEEILPEVELMTSTMETLSIQKKDHVVSTSLTSVPSSTNNHSVAASTELTLSENNDNFDLNQTSNSDQNSQSDSSKSLNNISVNNFKNVTTVPNRIFVGGIPLEITENQVYSLFSQFGRIESIRIISDHAGVSKGYMFITYERQEDAQKALREADNLTIKNKKLNISQAVIKQFLDRGVARQTSYQSNQAFASQAPAAVGTNFNSYFDGSGFSVEGQPFYQIASVGGGHLLQNSIGLFPAAYLTQPNATVNALYPTSAPSVYGTGHPAYALYPGAYGTPMPPHSIYHLPPSTSASESSAQQQNIHGTNHFVSSSQTSVPTGYQYSPGVVSNSNSALRYPMSNNNSQSSQINYANQQQVFSQASYQIDAAQNSMNPSSGVHYSIPIIPHGINGSDNSTVPAGQANSALIASYSNFSNLTSIPQTNLLNNNQQSNYKQSENNQIEIMENVGLSPVASGIESIPNQSFLPQQIVFGAAPGHHQEILWPNAHVSTAAYQNSVTSPNFQQQVMQTNALPNNSSHKHGKPQFFNNNRSSAMGPPPPKPFNSMYNSSQSLNYQSNKNYYHYNNQHHQGSSFKERIGGQGAAHSRHLNGSAHNYSSHKKSFNNFQNSTFPKQKYLNGSSSTNASRYYPDQTNTSYLSNRNHHTPQLNPGNLSRKIVNGVLIDCVENPPPVEIKSDLVNGTGSTVDDNHVKNEADFEPSNI